MRVLHLLMVLVLALGAFFAFWWQREADRTIDNAVHETRLAVERLESEIRIRAGLRDVPLNGRGWPVTVDPAWFGDSPPRNRLVKGVRPWVEVASSNEIDLDHPPLRIAVDGSQASFWYNPGKGIVRARVGTMVADEVALAYYNDINRCQLRTLVTPPPRAENRTERDLAAAP